MDGILKAIDDVQELLGQKAEDQQFQLQRQSQQIQQTEGQVLQLQQGQQELRNEQLQQRESVQQTAEQLLRKRAASSDDALGNASRSAEVQRLRALAHKELSLDEQKATPCGRSHTEENKATFSQSDDDEGAEHDRRPGAACAHPRCYFVGVLMLLSHPADFIRAPCFLTSLPVY